MSDHSPIAVIDFGSQYSQLIVRRVRGLGCFAKLYGPDELHLTGAPAAVILSGGPRSVSEPDAPDIDLDYLRSLGVPVLGVCYGMQLLNTKHGGDVKPSDRREYGPVRLDKPLHVGCRADAPRHRLPHPPDPATESPLQFFARLDWITFGVQPSPLVSL